MAAWKKIFMKKKKGVNWNLKKKTADQKRERERERERQRQRDRARDYVYDQEKNICEQELYKE